MINLKNKSEFNKDAAELLIENNLYASSIHCSYYSVFQLMTFRYCKLKGLNEETFSSEVSVNAGGGTHKYLITEFSKLIECRNSKREFENKVKDLKALRVKADYKNIMIDISKGNDAYMICKFLNNEIKKI